MVKIIDASTIHDFKFILVLVLITISYLSRRILQRRKKTEYHRNLEITIPLCQ